MYQAKGQSHIMPQAGVRSNNAGTWIAIAATCAAVILFGASAYKFSHTEGPVPMHTATSDKLGELAEKSQGDVSKLSSADRDWLNHAAPGGEGEKFLKLKYQSMH